MEAALKRTMPRQATGRGRMERSALVVRSQAVADAAPSGFKLPQKKTPLPTDAEGVRSAIAKTHEMHGQGRSMFFSLTGAGKRASAGSYRMHADTLDWNAVSSGSMDSYNIYT